MDPKTGNVHLIPIEMYFPSDHATTGQIAERKVVGVSKPLFATVRLTKDSRKWLYERCRKRDGRGSHRRRICLSLSFADSALGIAFPQLVLK